MLPVHLDLKFKTIINNHNDDGDLRNKCFHVFHEKSAIFITGITYVKYIKTISQKELQFKL